MKALILYGPAEPFHLEDIPDPVAGDGEVVVKVITCGAGLTIQHVKAGRTPVDYPKIIGHEITGEVVELGRGVTSLSIGDAVTAYFYLTCGNCKWCRHNRETLCENFKGYVGREVNGGYAEYIKLPADTFLRLPSGLDHLNFPAEVGVISDAIATPVKVIRRARVMPTDTIAVFGAGGGLGIHMVMLARWAHAKVIAVETKPAKFQACKEAGADEVIDGNRNDLTEALVEISGGGIDVGIDFVSSEQTLETAANALGKGGRLVTLGGSGKPFKADPKAMLEKELELIGSRYATKQEVSEALELVARGDVWPLVTDIRPMKEAEELHEDLENGNIIGRAAIRITN